MESEKIGKKLYVYHMDDLKYTVFCVPRTDRLDFDIYEQVETDKVENKDGGFVKTKCRKFRNSKDGGELVEVDKISEAFCMITGMVSIDGHMSFKMNKKFFLIEGKGEALALGEVLARVLELKDTLLET